MSAEINSSSSGEGNCVTLIDFLIATTYTTPVSSSFSQNRIARRENFICKDVGIEPGFGAVMATMSKFSEYTYDWKAFRVYTRLESIDFFFV